MIIEEIQKIFNKEIITNIGSVILIGLYMQWIWSFLEKCIFVRKARNPFERLRKIIYLIIFSVCLVLMVKLSLFLILPIWCTISREDEDEHPIEKKLEEK